MKSGEFDALVRQKFDENDFEFNPKNWERLEEQLDDRPKKRNMLIWWAMPVAGMAASVALAMGAASLVKYGMPSTAGAGSNVVAHHKTAQPKHAQRPAVEYTANTITPLQAEAQAAPVSKASSKIEEAVNNNDNNSNNGFNTRLQAIADNTPGLIAANDKHEAAKAKEAVITRKRQAAFNEWTMANVTEEEMQKASGLSVSVSGGINYGDRNNGFSAGASIRKMINNRVYVEGDVAFTNSANVQHDVYTAYEYQAAPANAARSAARTTGGTPEDPNAVTQASKVVVADPIKVPVTRQSDQLYTMQYAQLTPTIGYKIMDKFSIGAGPDFQQALADHRPTMLSDNPENQRVAPLFDIGLMGKTEVALAKRVKAAVYYRKGINNVITPMNKYIDRDYLQFQIRCTVFDK